MRIAVDRCCCRATAATYTVRIGLRLAENKIAATKPFEVKLQGRVMQRNMDLVQPAGVAGKAVVLQYRAVPVKDTLAVEFGGSVSGTTASAPAICFIEVIREEAN